MWLAVNKNGNEVCFDIKPSRFDVEYYNIHRWESDEANIGEGSFEGVHLPKGFIKKLIGKKLTWEDEPYEYI